MAANKNELSIAAEGSLDPDSMSGKLGLKANSRALAGIDRLLGAITDLPAALIEKRVDRANHERELERKFRDLQFKSIQALIQNFQTDQASLLQLQAPANLREFRRTLNLTAVVIDAVKQLPSDPDPTLALAAPDNGNEKSSAPWNDDWLNRYRLHAAEASSDEMRSLWSRILSEEIQNPGKFSSHTLSFLAEADKEIASDCEEISQISVYSFIPAVEYMQKGAVFAKALSLSSMGILYGVEGLLQNSITVREDGIVNFRQGKFNLTFSAPAGLEMKFSCWGISKKGQEVFSLIDEKNRKKGLENFVKALREHNPINTAKIQIFADDKSDIIISEENI